MSFFGKFKGGSSPGNLTSPVKKDPNALQPTPLEKHLAEVTGPVRPDGSDKFFGFENYGSTCYCNSIVQCLYYSAPFRENVLNFPSQQFLESIRDELPQSNGGPISPRNKSTTPYPNLASPARKVAPPTSPGPAQKPEETKDSPEYKKKLALQAGPVLDMVYDNSNRYGMDESLFTSLKDIFEAIIQNKSRLGVVSPHKFLEILRRENEMFRSAMHQDAHEFLNLLLNQVIDNVDSLSNKHPAPIKSPPQVNGDAPEHGLAAAMSSAVAGAYKNGLDTHWVHDLFEGLLTSETRCLTCENTSQRDEAFLDLSVDLSAHTSVTSCLRKFSEEEMLCERNKFHCDNCGGLQEAEKRMKIKRLPRILALHLKRFKYTEDLQRLQKLFHRVVYPFHLRLFNTTDDAEDPDRLYELYAVVVHIGGGPYHGHYVSIIKTEDRGWLLFDDELVEPVDKNYVLNFFGGEPVPGVQDAKQLACAYVLFYQETTLEAVMKEQEAEGHYTEPPMRTSEEPVLSTQSAKTNSNNLHTTMTVMTPPTEELDHMSHLTHAATAPILAIPTPQQYSNPSQHLPTTPALQPILPTKSKKELKAEEKERKAQIKADEKIAIAKRKESATKRMEMWKKQDEDLKAAIEMSKASAAEDAARRPPGKEGAEQLSEKLAPLGSGGVPREGEKERSSGGLARFARHGSMSLRGKPKLFGSKEKDVGSPGEVREGSGQTDEEKAKKNRFSLGRKKSAVLQ
ncbi:hypothetical protein LTR95_005339 [Oleoguttula sp. CCFEE 5521]